MDDQRLRPSKRKASELSAQAQGDTARNGQEAQYAAQDTLFSSPVSAMQDTSHEPNSDVSHLNAATLEPQSPELFIPDDGEIN